MTTQPDPIDAVVRRLESGRPGPEPASLRQGIMACYDGEFSPRTRRGVVWVKRVLAAAALLAAAFLAGRMFQTATPLEERFVIQSVDTVLMEARLALLQAELRAAEVDDPGQAEETEPTAEEPLSVEDRMLALAESEPAVLRIAAARALETLDPSGAARRYREVLSVYPSSAMTAVARARLAVLDH